MEQKIYHYNLEMHEGVREGLILELTGNGKKGLGEIAPLPGWSSENLKQVLEELESKKRISPSVLFGLEMAELQLVNSIKLPTEVPISPLLMGSEKEILKQAEKLENQGVSSIKLKLGSFQPKRAAQLVKELKSSFLLRIDLNRCWTLQESLFFCSHFSQEDFDYLEEPCQKFADLFKFDFPIAVDESLREQPLNEILKIPKLKALIFKPTLQGGVGIGKILAAAAAQRGIDLIFSSSYESGLGILQIIHLCYYLQVPIKPLGLDTYKFLKEDLLLERLSMENGKLKLPFSTFDLDMSKLTAI
jgi:O-succinylbenzoate synthase